jgi:GST-like protein
MSNSNYQPPKQWQWQQNSEGTYSNVNRPISGATHEQKLARGEHRFQLYSLATPNGVKVTTLFEELLELGHKEAEYDAYPINILKGDQFGSDFTEINPNSKIPAMVDTKANLTLFESGSILIYLAELFKEFLPTETAKRTATMNWLFWQVGSAPFVGGGFGHFYAYAPEKIEYPINRYTMETKRQLDVLEKQLADNEFMIGEEYTIADIAIWPWYGYLVLGKLYDSAEFLDVESYTNVQRWAKQISNRPAVKRGCMVNRTWGEPEEQLAERHSATDFS